MEDLNAPLQRELEELISGYRFDNLIVHRRFRIANRTDGYVGARWILAVKDRTCMQMYPHMDVNPHGYGTPELLRAFVGEDDRERFTNFVNGSFPLMKEPWRKMLEGSNMAFPNDVHDHLPAVFEMLFNALHEELEKFRIDHTSENVQRLLAVRLAAGGKLLPGSSPVAGLPNELVEWLRAEIDTEVILYAFGPQEAGDAWRGPNVPLIPLAEAKEAAGIPLRRLRALYPGAREQPTGNAAF